MTIRDPKGHVEKWDVEIGTCREDEDASARNMFLEGKDRMFLVDTNAIHQQASILEYFCTSKLKPIPMVRRGHTSWMERLAFILCRFV